MKNSRFSMIHSMIVADWRRTDKPFLTLNERIFTRFIFLELYFLGSNFCFRILINIPYIYIIVALK